VVEIHLVRDELPHVLQRHGVALAPEEQSLLDDELLVRHVDDLASFSPRCVHTVIPVCNSERSTMQRRLLLFGGNLRYARAQRHRGATERHGRVGRYTEVAGDGWALVSGPRMSIFIGPGGA
jgi:hypothetical protein